MQTTQTDSQSFAYKFKNEMEVIVTVWNDRQLFLKNSPHDGLECYAFFHPAEYKAEQLPTGELKPIYQKYIGEIHLVKGDYGSGVITHECSHACIQWLQMSGLNLKDNDEDFCYELGMIVSKFWKWHFEVLESRIGMS
jgi:hypothetical protein